MFPHASLHTRDRRTHHRVSLRLVHAGGGADRRRSGRVGIGRARPLHLGGPERASRHRPGDAGVAAAGGGHGGAREPGQGQPRGPRPPVPVGSRGRGRATLAGHRPRSRDRHRRIGPGACVSPGRAGGARTARRRGGGYGRGRRHVPGGAAHPGLRSSGRRRTWCRNSRGPHSGRSSNSPRPPPPSPAGAAGPTCRPGRIWWCPDGSGRRRRESPCPASMRRSSLLP